MYFFNNAKHGERMKDREGVIRRKQWIAMKKQKTVTSAFRLISAYIIALMLLTFTDKFVKIYDRLMVYTEHIADAGRSLICYCLKV